MLRNEEVGGMNDLVFGAANDVYLKLRFVLIIVGDFEIERLKDWRSTSSGTNLRQAQAPTFDKLRHLWSTMFH